MTAASTTAQREPCKQKVCTCVYDCGEQGARGNLKVAVRAVYVDERQQRYHEQGADCGRDTLDPNSTVKATTPTASTDTHVVRLVVQGRAARHRHSVCEGMRRWCVCGQRGRWQGRAGHMDEAEHIG